MKFFNLTKKSYTCRAISLVVSVSFLGSMLIVQTAKAEFPFNGIFQSLKNTSEALMIEEVIEELPMKEWVLKQVADAGLDPAEAEVIITCESRWNPDAMGVNNNRSVDLGLWQINSIHKDISNADKLDYKKATEWAIDKRLKDGSWRAWYCSRKIAYLK